MALKFKRPFGPGVSTQNEKKLQEQRIRRSLRSKGLRLKSLQPFRGGTFTTVPIKKGKQVSTPRRTSRGISF